MSVKEFVVRLKPGEREAALRLDFADGGMQEKTLPLSVFAESFQRWVRKEEVQAGTAASTTAVLEALRVPDRWQVNALATPLRYAFLQVGDWRVAVACRPAQRMTLHFDGEYTLEGEDCELVYDVPPRVVASVWNGPALNAGIMCLVSNEAEFPIAPNDDIHRVVSWPWGNVSEMGQICWGSTRRPTWGVDGITNIESAFFGSLFNNHIVRAGYGENEDGEEVELDLYRYHRLEAECDSDPIHLPVGRHGTRRRLLALLEHSVVSPWG